MRATSTSEEHRPFTYKVRIEAGGFKAWEQTGLALQVGRTRTWPVLEVGAYPPRLLSTQPPLQSIWYRRKRVAHSEGSACRRTPGVWPKRLRPGLSHAGMTGAATQTGADTTQDYAININAAGLRQEQNGYEIDGAQTIPRRVAAEPPSLPIRDRAIDGGQDQRFRCPKRTQWRCDGRRLTVSGSNQYTELLTTGSRNNNLSALTHFQSSSAFTSANEVSGTMGGPVFKNKLFLVRRDRRASFQVSRLRIVHLVETQDFYNYVNTNLETIGGNPNYALQSLTMARPDLRKLIEREDVAQIDIHGVRWQLLHVLRTRGAGGRALLLPPWNAIGTGVGERSAV